MTAPHGPQLHPDGTATFHVWAPRAERVELLVGDQRLGMTPEDRGWHGITAPSAHGQRYAFSLDAGPARPDPASRWQPDGVHEPSCLLDPTTFAWSEAEAAWQPPPLGQAAIYELHIGTFTSEGTFEAAAQRVGALAELGITHVEVMPVAAFSGRRGWGYDGVCWRAVHEPYGGAAGFAALVDACHRAGLAVILDVVYNHFGPSGNYLTEFAPYLTDRYRTPWGDAINLDGPGSDEVRGLIVGSALAWLRDYHVDALRLDAVHALLDTSATHILAELSAATDDLAERLGRPLALIAESDRNDPATLRPRDQGGLGIHAQWADDLHHAIHTAVTGERDGHYADYAGLPDVVAAYQDGFAYAGRYSPARERTVGAPLPDAVAGTRLVGCAQNHDQVGNRALGQRLTVLTSEALARACAVLLCAAPHTPLLFMGEEHGARQPFLYFTSHVEPELAEAVRQGRRSEFAAFSGFDEAVPDPQDEQTFRSSILDWADADADRGRQRRALWRDLLALRRSWPALGGGRRDLVEPLVSDSDCLVLLRGAPDGAADVLLAVNIGEAPAERAATIPDGNWQPLLTSDDQAYGGSGTAATMSVSLTVASLWLPAASATLLTARPPS